LRALLVGSEGIFGVITEVTLRVRHVPSTSRYEGIFLPSWQAGLDAFRVLAQAGLKPDVMRLSDADETAATMSMSGPTGRTADALHAYLRARGAAGGVVAILGWEGTAVAVPARRGAAWELLKRHGAVGVGRKVGESWKRGRYSGPYLRDVLLDEGYLVETLETATEWSRLPALHDALGSTLRSALADGGPGPLVMSHVSHVYETGASLYITVLARAGDDPGARWAAAKRAAGDLIAGSGATITHHHAVGRDHVPWLEQEVGPLGVGILRAVKAELDPAGVLNPGVLLPS
jgi:alkyldihydroxyacetonephosphate synthase